MQRDTRSTKIVFWHGFNTFLLYNIVATYWVTNTAFAAGLFAVVVNSFLMCLPWLAFHWTSRVSPKVSYLSLIAFWVAFEHFHYHWSLNWPWLTLGNGFAQFPSLIQWYEVTGVLGGTAWILLVNYLALRWYLSPKPRRAPIYVLAAALLPMAASLIRYTTYPQSLSPSVPQSPSLITLSTLQPNLEPHYEKFTEDESAQLEIFTALSQKALAQAPAAVDYLLLPETSFSRIEEGRINAAPALRALMDALPPDEVRYLVTGYGGYYRFQPGGGGDGCRTLLPHRRR